MRRRVVLWSPHHPQRFACASNDLRLYDLKIEFSSLSADIKIFASQTANAGRDFTLTSASSGRDKGGDDKALTLFSVCSEVRDAKCIAWHPSSPSTVSGPSSSSAAAASAAGPSSATGVEMIAAGLPNGRVALARMEGKITVVREFVPNHSRACNAVAWNPIDTSLIASGLDKLRSDCSLLIWDINRAETSSQRSSSRAKGSGSGHGRIQLANSEATLSLAWLPGMAQCIVAGTGNKWIRIYDLRERASPASVMAHTRGVNGVRFDPFDPNRMATFSDDGTIKVWDVRALSNPSASPTPLISITNDSRAMLQVEWCPTSRGTLASLSRDEHQIRLWSLRECHTPTVSSPSGSSTVRTINPEESRSLAMDRPPYNHYAREPLLSFSWHPSNSKLVLLAGVNATVRYSTVREFSPINISPQNDLAICVGRTVIDGVPDLRERDISMLMKERAVNGYGMDISRNHTLAQRHFPSDLRSLWEWMEREEFGDKGSSRSPFDGVYSIILSRNKDEKSKVEPSADSLPVAYSSPQRLQSLKKCGWSFGSRKGDFNEYIHSLEQGGQSSRAAALAVLFHDVKKAIKTLNRSAERNRASTSSKSNSIASSSDGPVSPPRANNADGTATSQLNAREESSRSTTVSTAVSSILSTDEGEHLSASKSPMNKPGPSPSSSTGGSRISQGPFNVQNARLVAMALAGYSERETGLWSETCSGLASQLEDPYLRVCFYFLCSRDDSFAPVLSDSAISLWDRIAFACRFLPDDKLAAYIEKTTTKSVQNGNLEGIVLTGLSERGVDLLQAYVNRTADVQTAALVMSHVVPSHFSDYRVTQWLSQYRQLLDLCSLWHTRCMLDISLGKKAMKPPQVFARCTYCHKSIALGMLGPKKGMTVSSRYGYGKAPMQMPKAKIAACPTCNKPLPKCAVCLLPLNCRTSSSQPSSGAGGGSVSRGDGNSGDNDGSLPFNDWFTWCQSCRHGGHSEHMLQWFESHPECPVTDCNCKCGFI